MQQEKDLPVPRRVPQAREAAAQTATPKFTGFIACFGGDVAGDQKNKALRASCLRQGQNLVYFPLGVAWSEAAHSLTLESPQFPVTPGHDVAPLFTASGAIVFGILESLAFYQPQA